MKKSNFSCIKCADKERYKRRLKQRVWNIYLRMQLHYLLVVVVVTDVSDVAVIFAIT